MSSNFRWINSLSVSARHSIDGADTITSGVTIIGTLIGVSGWLIGGGGDDEGGGGVLNLVGVVLCSSSVYGGKSGNGGGIEGSRCFL